MPEQESIPLPESHPESAAAGGALPERPVLLVRSGAWRCALPVGDVVEILRPLPIEVVPGLPPFLLGLSVIRGQAVPIVDLAQLMGAPPSPRQRVVLMRAGERRVGLMVEQVAGVEYARAEQLAEMPPLLEGGTHEFVQTIAARDRELLVVLQAGRVVPEQWWAELAAARDS